MSIELSERRPRGPSNGLPEVDEISMEVEAFPDGGLKAYLVLFGSFMGLMVNLGLLNLIGAIQAYVSLHQLKDTSATLVAWIFSIYWALAYGTGIFVGSAFDKYGSFLLLVASTVFLVVGLLATANSTRVWHFILSSIVLGLGNGVGMPPLVAVIGQWFFKKRGTCMGIATSAGSVGGTYIQEVGRNGSEKEEGYKSDVLLRETGDENGRGIGVIFVH